MARKFKEASILPTNDLILESSKKGDSYIKTRWGVYKKTSNSELCDGSTKQNKEKMVG